MRLDMRLKTPPNSEILNWDPENMEAYWQQCRQFDTRSLSDYEKYKTGRSEGRNRQFIKRLRRMLKRS